MAVNRLQCTERRLQQDPETASAYEKVIQDYQDKGYIRKVSPEQLENGKQWFLPHFPIVKKDRTTTKTRLVFDASAQFQGISLNNNIHVGPKLQRDLPTVLTRFRRKPIGIMCDIAEMYLQIELDPADKPYHRFLWRGSTVLSLVSMHQRFLLSG